MSKKGFKAKATLHYKQITQKHVPRQLGSQKIV